MIKKYFLVVIIFSIITITFAQQEKTSEKWIQFRGPNGSGLSETSGLPQEFGPNKNVIWKTPLATGHSSPILTQEYIFLTASDQEKLITLCLDRKNGKILWQKQAPRPRKEKLDFRNNPASPSPVTDGKNVYIFFPDFGLLGYDQKGNELWRLPLGPYNNLYGMGASPILADDKVILVCDQNTDSYILAVDKTSGKVIWRKDRPEAKSGHSTPIVYTSEEGETQILVPGSFLLIAYSAKTGDRIWWVGGLAFEMKSIPVISKGILYINGFTSPMNQPENLVKLPSFEQALSQFDTDKNSLLSTEELPDKPEYGWVDFVDINQDGSLDKEDWNLLKAALGSLNGMLAIRLGGKGDMTDSNSIWQYRRFVPQLPSPLLYKNVLYMLNDAGYLTTLKPETGEVIHRGRLRGSGSKFFASPVAADDKVFIISLRGRVSVLKPDGSLDVIARSDLKEECYATPAISNGRIYLRTTETLYCFGTN